MGVGFVQKIDILAGLDQIGYDLVNGVKAHGFLDAGVVKRADLGGSE